MKKIKKLEGNESYLVFLGYDYSPSGFDICRLSYDKKSFETQSNGSEISYDNEMEVFELPIPEAE